MCVPMTLQSQTWSNKPNTNAHAQPTIYPNGSKHTFFFFSRLCAVAKLCKLQYEIQYVEECGYIPIKLYLRKPQLEIHVFFISNFSCW